MVMGEGGDVWKGEGGSGLKFLPAGSEDTEKQMSATMGSGWGGDTHVYDEATAMGEDTWRLTVCGIWPCQERQAMYQDMFLGESSLKAIWTNKPKACPEESRALATTCVRSC